MKITVKELIHSYKMVEHDKYDLVLLEWLVETGHFYLEQEVYLDWKREVPNELLDEFRHSQQYDVLVFGDKVWLIYENVSYDDAKRICSDSRTKGKNWFAGFAIHGQYKNIPKGHPLPVKPQEQLSL